jgi:hypothetical protein
MILHDHNSWSGVSKMTIDDYIDTRAASAFLGISPSKLNKLRVSGDGPSFFRPGGMRRVLYKRSDLIAWMEAGRRISTSPMWSGKNGESV